MQTKEKVTPLRPIDLVLKESWYLFAASWLKFLLFSLFSAGIVLLSAIIYLVPAILYLGQKDWSNFDPATFDWQSLVSDMALPLVIYFLIGFILFLLLVTLIDLATAHYVYRLAKKEIITITNSYRYGLKNLFSYLWLHLLVFLIVFFAFLLLIIPALYAIIVLSLVTPVFVLEQKRGFAVLKRSKDLIKGYFWPVTGRLAFLILISVAVSYLQEIPFLAPLGMVVQFVLTFYGIIYLLLVYQDLISVKENKKTQPEEKA